MMSNGKGAEKRYYYKVLLIIHTSGSASMIAITLNLINRLIDDVILADQ